MKKIISLLLTVMLMTAYFCMPTMAEGNMNISVLLDGEYVAFDVAPVIVDGRTLVPVRAIFEALGATVDWQQETQTVVSNKGGTDITLKINDATMYKNGEAITLDVPAQLVGNRTLVPVRAISEAYGCYVDWNDWNKTVLIVSDLDKTAVATINGEDVTAGFYHYVFIQTEANAMQSMGLQPDDLNNTWNSNLGGMTFGEYIANMTLEQCMYIKANVKKAKEAGISLSDEDRQEIDGYVQSLVDMYVSEDADHLKEMGLTENSVREYLADYVCLQTYADVLLGNTTSDEEVEKYLDKNYVRAKHILISTMDVETGMPLPEEKVAAKKKLAEQLLTKIRIGSNFNKLIEEYGEDPGMEQNPDGYLFTDGEMIEEFEAAVKNLAIGEVSGIVESVYGFHIIKRVANGNYSDVEIEQAKSIIVSQIVDEAFEANMMASQVFVKALMLSLMVPMSN